MAQADTKRKQQGALKGKGWLVWLGVAGALGVWLIADLQQPAREPDAEPLVSDYVHLTAGDVTRVEVKREKGPFTLVRSGSDWTFQAPAAFDADDEAVKTWLEGFLEKANVSRKVEGKPQGLDQYGLDKPAVEVVLTRRGGETRTLQVGKEYPVPGVTGAGYYARESRDGRLFLLASTQATDLRDKKSDDLREKDLLALKDTKDVRKVVLQRPAGAVELERRGEKWELVQPFRAPAENIQDTFLADLKNAAAESFVENNAADLAKYGLAAPRLTVRVTDGKGQHGLLFGKEGKDGKVYASREGGKEVVLVTKSTFDNLNKTAGDLREKRLVTLDREKITNLELQNAHGSVKLRKVGENQWEFADAPDPKQRKAKGDRIQTILTDLTGTARKFVEEAPKDLVKYGLDPAPIRVIVNDGSGTSQVYQLGKKSKDGYFARGSAGPVFEVDAYVFDDLNVKRDAFKETDSK
jgi:hypothetical protein